MQLHRQFIATLKIRPEKNQDRQKNPGTGETVKHTLLCKLSQGNLILS